MGGAEHVSYDVVIIGSGAGGAVTALECARAGLSVLVMEEGDRHPLSAYGAPAHEAMGKLFRRGGMTPIMGRVPMGFVEGMCLGGSTEVNSGFWCRPPRETLLRWAAEYGLDAASYEELTEHFEWAESILDVSTSPRAWPPSSQLFARGAEVMGWSIKEVERMARACQGANLCASGCPNGAKGMTRRVIPEAQAAGAIFATGHRAEMLLTRRGRVDAVLASARREDGSEELVRIDAAHVFVCCGAMQTPALLRRSGIYRQIGNTLRVHPMLKVVARFPEPINADKDVLSLLQVREFWPDISLGGAFFTPGHAAMALSENWPRDGHLLESMGHLGAWYVAVRGIGKGSVRPSAWARRDTNARYDLAPEDLRHLSRGLARLSALLLAAGAMAVYPAVWGMDPIETEVDAARWLSDVLPRNALALTTVHAFSSCPMGSDTHRCPLDSFGQVRGYANLHVNDASMLPDSPGVNPQGRVVALSRRNVHHFLEKRS
jgi:choline dehydrogenase-like flavoprotein